MESNELMKNDGIWSHDESDARVNTTIELYLENEN